MWTQEERQMCEAERQFAEWLPLITHNGSEHFAALFENATRTHECVVEKEGDDIFIVRFCRIERDANANEHAEFIEELLRASAAGALAAVACFLNVD